MIAEPVEKLQRMGIDLSLRLASGTEGAKPPRAVPVQDRHTLQLLDGLGYRTGGFRSKSWDEFAKSGGPAFDFVFTICDHAAAEACPVWPGQPMTAHWGIPDPAQVRGTPAEIALAFKDAYRMLNQRIGLLAALPIQSLDRLSLQHRLTEIGRMQDATETAETA